MTCTLIEDKAILRDKRLADTLRQKGFGEQKANELIFDLFEAKYLADKEKIELLNTQGEKVKEDEFLKQASKKIRDYYTKYLVFRDMRDKGFVVKTGFKFGFDFRVYPRGKKAGEAHSQWCINVATQNDKKSFIELSRMVRLASNLKTKLLNAVVDSENEINYYEMQRITP